MRLDNNSRACLLQSGSELWTLIRNARMSSGGPEETATEATEREHFCVLQFLLKAVTPEVENRKTVKSNEKISQLTFSLSQRMINVLPIDLRLLPVYALLLQMRIDLIGVEMEFG